METHYQTIIGTDKRNPYFQVFHQTKAHEIHVYYGFELLEVISDKKDNPGLKLLLARLYNANIKVKSLITHFGYSYPTIRKWGLALKSGDGEKLITALEGSKYPRKLSVEIQSFVVHQFNYIYPRNKYTYSKEIRDSIKDVFGIEISAESLRPIFKELKGDYYGEAPSALKKRVSRPLSM